MSAAAWPTHITEPRAEWEARVRRMGELEYRVEDLAAASQTLQDLADALGVSLGVLRAVAAAGPDELHDLGEQLAGAVEAPSRVSVCCGTPVVWHEDWHCPTGVPGETVTEEGWRCARCGSVSDETMPGRRAG